MSAHRTGSEEHAKADHTAAGVAHSLPNQNRMGIRRRACGLAMVVAVSTAFGASAESAAWISTHPLNGNAQERVEVGEDSSVWAVIDHNRIIRSTDLGLTWTVTNPVATGGVPVVIPGTPSTGPEAGGSTETRVAPLNGQTALAVNGDAFSRTDDGGMTWKRIAVPKVTVSRIEDNQFFRRSGNRFWAAMRGSELDRDGCAVPLRTTPLLMSGDGRQWVRRDLPVADGLVEDLKFVNPLLGAVSIVPYKHNKTGTSGVMCGYTNEGSATDVYVTTDGGRRWTRRLRCAAVCSLAWASDTSRRLLAVNTHGEVFESRNDGMTFRAGPRVADNVRNAFGYGIDAVDCFGRRCWALANGSGMFVKDGSNEWQLEVSPNTAPCLCIGALAAIDADHAVAAAPYTVMTRVVTDAARHAAGGAVRSSR